MWRLKMSLTDTCIYQGKKVTSLGVRAQVKDLVIGGKSVSTTAAFFFKELFLLIKTRYHAHILLNLRKLFFDQSLQNTFCLSK